MKNFCEWCRAKLKITLEVYQNDSNCRGKPKKTPKEFITGISFASDWLRRSRKFLLSVTECFEVKLINLHHFLHLNGKSSIIRNNRLL